MSAAKDQANGSKSNRKHKIEDTEIQGSPKKPKSDTKKQILLNAFDMSGTIGHLSPGQWKVYLTHRAHIAQN
jgi:hypothetical protein